MIVNLNDEGKQVIVTGGRDNILLQVWANRGSLGVTLTIKQASQLRTALLAAIVSATVENIDTVNDCR